MENNNYSLRKKTPHKPVQGVNNQPRPKKKFTPFLIAGLVAVLAIIIVWIFLPNKKKPSTDNVSSNKNSDIINSLFNFTSPVKDYLGYDSLINRINKTGLGLKADINIDNLGFTDISKDDISGLSLSYEFIKDSKSAKKNNTLSVGYRGINALSMSSYSDPDTFMFSIPLLSPSVYSFDTTKFNDMYISVLTSDTFSEKTNYSLFMLFNNIINHMTADYSEHIENDFLGIFNADNSEAVSELKNALVSKPAEEKYNNCTGTTYTINGEPLKNYILYLYEKCAKNYAIVNFFSSTCGIEINVPTDYADIFDTFSADEATISIWRNSDGVIEGLEASSEFIINDNMPYVFKFTRDININESISTVTSELEIVTPSKASVGTTEKTSYKIIETIDSSTGEYKLSITVPYNENNIELILMGAFEEVKKGASFNFTVDNLTISQDFKNLLSLNGEIRLSASIKKPKKLSGDVLDITELNLNEINDNLEEIYDFFSKVRINNE